MPFTKWERANYMIIEAPAGDVEALADEVNTVLNTNLWLALGGLAVKTNGNVIQALAKKSVT